MSASISEALAAAADANRAASHALHSVIAQMGGGRALDGGAHEAASQKRAVPRVEEHVASGPDHCNARPHEALAMTDLETGNRKVDTLSCPMRRRPVERYGIGCRDDVCYGAMMDKRGGPWSNFADEGELVAPSPEQCLAEAESYLTLFHKEHKLSQDKLDSRLAAVRAEISERKTYRQTAEEAWYGAKVAWRNSSRCINRIQWNRMEFIDQRHVKTAQECFEALCEHMRTCIQNGRIVTTISLFPPLDPATGKAPMRIWNTAATAFAGYQDEAGGKVLGDPANVELTRTLIKLG